MDQTLKRFLRGDVPCTGEWLIIGGGYNRGRGLLLAGGITGGVAYYWRGITRGVAYYWQSITGGVAYYWWCITGGRGLLLAGYNRGAWLIIGGV